MENDRVDLSTEEALSLLPKEDLIHTFRSIGRVLIGADWDREELVDLINRSHCEIGGSKSIALGHGLVIWSGTDPLFVHTIDDNESINRIIKKKETEKGAEGDSFKKNGG
jgi:hypothetical protein